MHHFTRSLTAAAPCAGALVAPGAAHAAAPWSDPVVVPGSPGQATSAPFPATPWPGGHGFDLTFGALAAGDRIAYVGTHDRRVQIAFAPGPESAWRTELRGPETGGARVAAAAAPHGAALAFSTFGAGSIGSVYVVRQSGVKAPGPTEKLSGRGHLRSVAVSVNARGDVLVGWDRSGTVEVRPDPRRAARLRRPAFGPAEPVSAPTPNAHEPSAAFDRLSNRIVLAWQSYSGAANQVEAAQRPAP